MRASDARRPPGAAGPAGVWLRRLYTAPATCNYAKDALGWHARPRHSVEVTTPTGHTYRSTAPPLPGTPVTAGTRVEIYLTDLVLTA